MTLQILINEILIRNINVCDGNKIGVMVLIFLLLLSANIYYVHTVMSVLLLILFIFGTSLFFFSSLL